MHNKNLVKAEVCKFCTTTITKLNSKSSGVLNTLLLVGKKDSPVPSSRYWLNQCCYAGKLKQAEQCFDNTKLFTLFGKINQMLASLQLSVHFKLRELKGF